MARCEECIHERVCVIKAFPDAFENTQWEKEPCDHFKDADVVEVVRCKDCKHWCIQEGNDINQSYFCSRDKMWCMPTREADDFCSYGERKE